MKGRILISLLITALLLSLAGCSAGSSDATSDSATSDQPSDIRHLLVKTVKTYQKNLETDKWEPDNTVTLTYENAYPTLFETVYDDADKASSKRSCQYTFENGMPLTRIDTVDYASDKTTVAYKDGKVYDITYESEGKDVPDKKHYQYADDDEYFTMVLQEVHEKADESHPAGTNEEVDSVSVTTANGLLKRTTNTGIYANWTEGEKKEWLRFRGVYTADYDGDGIISTLTADFGADGVVEENRYKVTRQDGKITEITVQIQENDEWKELQKYAFEYTDTEISPARHSLMMNYFIIGSRSNYYHYNWY